MTIGRFVNPTRRRMAARDEHGISTLFVVFFAVAMLAVAGLVIDGGYALGAKRNAMNVAEQAARVGADSLDQGALRSGATRVSPSRAVTAAQAYLAHVGATGTVTIDGGEVTVTVTKEQTTTILSAINVTHLDVAATATAVSINEDTG